MNRGKKSQEHLHSEVVRAGAGAGKTTRLTQKVLQLAQDFYEEHQSFPKVVVTTFTRKATQELRERLMLLARERGEHLVDFVNSSSSLQILTIHGVLNILLSRHGHSVGIESGFRFISEKQESRKVRRLVREILLEDSSYQEFLESYSFNDLCSLLRSFYEKRVEFLDKFRPYSLVDLEKLALQRAKEVACDLEEIANSIQSETSNEKWLEYSQFFKNLSEKLKIDSWDDIEIFLTEVKLPRQPIHKTSDPEVSDETIQLCKKAKEYFSRSKSQSILSVSFQKSFWIRYQEMSSQFERIGEAFYKRWNEIKWNTAKITMSDLETLSLQLVRDYPQVAKRFSAEWDYWLIDEYQDTSPLQVELLQKLVGESHSFVVGDPQQSIYLFRGARSEVFERREQVARQRGDSLGLLKKNYRSTPRLLLFFNDFFSGLGSQFQAMEPHFEKDKEGEKVVAHFMQVDEEQTDEELEPLVVARHVGELLEKGVEADQICVLARANKDLEKIAQALQSFNCPVQVHSSGGFYKRREIRDALCFLKFLVNPHDNLNLLSVLRSPWFKVLDSEIAEALKEKVKKEKSYYRFFLESVSQKASWNGVYRLQELRLLSEKIGTLSAFETGVIESGMIDFSHHYDVTGRRESNIWKLISCLRQESYLPGFSFLNFVANQDVELSLEGSSEGDAVASWEPNRVNLMTVHASKGLQFDHVFLPYLSKTQKISQLPRFVCNEDQGEWQGRWALAIPFGDDDKMTHSVAGKEMARTLHKRDIEEADRILYVALTRAKKTVSLFFNGKIKKNSCMSRVHWDLTPGLHHKEHYSFEVLHESELPLLEKLTQATEEVTLPDKCSYWTGEGSIAHGVTSVTEMLKNENKQGDNNGFVEISKFIERAQQGTDLHKVFESLRYQGVEGARKLMKTWFPEEPKKLKALKYIEELQKPNLLQIIENGHTEWGFLCHLEGQTVEGQIDIWGRDESGVWIVDYKTGSSDYKERAFEQLKIYATALERSGLIKKEEKIFLAVTYPLLEKTEVQPFPGGLS